MHLAEQPAALPRLPAIAHPWVSSLRSPFFVTTWPERSPEQEIEQYLAAIHRWITDVSSPWATAIDMSGFNATTSTAAQRRTFVERSQPLRPYFELHCAAVGVVSPSSLIRGVVTAVLWLIPPPIPVQMFSTLDDAMRWAEGHLESRAQALSRLP